MFKNLLEINPQEEVNKIIAFLKLTLSEQKIDHLAIGISGGIDSATSLALALRVLKPEQITAVHLPYFDDMDPDIKALEKKFDIKIEVRAIKKMTDCLIEELDVPKDDKVRRGNVMARARMITLFDLAKEKNALVLGTENRSEYHLGYFTRFGDAASDIEPLEHMYKTQVYELAKVLEVPDSIIKKSPSANLWSSQTDEGEFGFSYQEADPVLFLFYDKKNPLWTIEQMTPGAKKIIEFSEKNHFKHNVPYHL
jgi:NAD+ synthase